jgi:hypothetical protein
MTNTNKLDQALKTLILNNRVDFEILQKQIDNQEITNEMPKFKQGLLFSKLISEPQSLGSLFLIKLKLKHLTTDILASKLGVAPNLITDLLADKVVPSKVPVLIMKKILNDFQLTFQDIEQAMNETFSKFTNQTNHTLSVTMHRKGGNGHSFQKETSSHSIFTEEIKDKYIAELKQLMGEAK